MFGILLTLAHAKHEALIRYNTSKLVENICNIKTYQPKTVSLDCFKSGLKIMLLCLHQGLGQFGLFQTLNCM